jgi:hypothetical protein
MTRFLTCHPHQHALHRPHRCSDRSVGSAPRTERSSTHENVRGADSTFANAVFSRHRDWVPQVGRTRQTCAKPPAQVSEYRDLWHPWFLDMSEIFGWAEYYGGNYGEGGCFR